MKKYICIESFTPYFTKGLTYKVIQLSGKNKDIPTFIDNKGQKHTLFPPFLQKTMKPIIIKPSEGLKGIEKEFTDFLKEHNVLIPFIVNLSIYRNIPYLTYIKEVIPKFHKRNLVWAAFYWNYTTEGFYFWKDITNKWKNRITIKKV